MKTTKLPQSAWHDAQAAGSQSQSVNQSESYYPTSDNRKQTGRASNDAIYKNSFEKDSVNKALLIYALGYHKDRYLARFCSVCILMICRWFALISKYKCMQTTL